MAKPLRLLTQHIKDSEEFKGSSVTARLEGAEYIVYSYSTIIAKFKYNTLIYFDDTSHSQTTSKLQHLIRGSYTINGSKLGIPKTHKEHTDDG